LSHETEPVRVREKVALGGTAGRPDAQRHAETLTDLFALSESAASEGADWPDRAHIATGPRSSANQGCEPGLPRARHDRPKATLTPLF
jgi:hypothetical protein